VRTLAPLGQFVPRLLNNLGLTPEKYGLLSLIEREISNLGGGAQVIGLKGNYLYVEVESPSHYSELSMRKREILRSVQKDAPDLNLSQLQIRVILKGASTKK